MRVRKIVGSLNFTKIHEIDKYVNFHFSFSVCLWNLKQKIKFQYPLKI